MPDEPQFPFGGLPFLNDMMKQLASQGPLNWDVATQSAAAGARGDTPDPEPDPSTRFEFNALADIAGMHVQQATGLPAGRREVFTATRAVWAHRTLQDLRPLFTELAASMGRPAQDGIPDQGDGDNDATPDPLAAMFSQLSSLMFPSLMGLTIGSMIGSLAQRAFGQYDLPIPRPQSKDLLVVPHTVDTFAADWSIARDDLRMWVLVHELTSDAVLGSPAAVGGLLASITSFVGAFRPDPTALMDRLGELDPADPASMARLQQTLGDPMLLVGAMSSDEQAALRPVLDAQVAALTAFVDHTVDRVGSSVLGNPAPIAEAVRRRRIGAPTDTDLAERLLGVSLPRDLQRRGADFVAGVVERAGDDGLRPLLLSPDNLPTPSELVAPGLWLARLAI